MGRDDRPDVDRAVDWTERFLSEAFASGDLSAATYRRLLTRLEVRRERPQPRVPVTTGAQRAGVPLPIPPMPAYRPAPPPSALVPANAGPTSGCRHHLRCLPRSATGSPAFARPSPPTSRSTGSRISVCCSSSREPSASSSSPSERCRTRSGLTRSSRSPRCCSVRRGSCVAVARPVVATAMGLVAGVLLPVVLFASFVDGVAFPPEMQGNALAAAVAVTSLLLAVAYSAVAIKWPARRFATSSLRWCGPLCGAWVWRSSRARWCS